MKDEPMIAEHRAPRLQSPALSRDKGCAAQAEPARPARLAAAWLGVGLCSASLAAWAGPQDEALPQRNLLIEWRMNEQGQVQRSQQGVRTGQVIVDSHGGVIGRTSIGISTVQTESRSDTVQQVQVLNGGRARLYVGRSQPYTVWQWAGGYGGAAGATSAATSGSHAGNEANGGSLGVIGPQSTPSGRGAVASGQMGALAQGSVTNSSANTNSGYPPQVWAQTVWIDLGQGLSVAPRWRGGRAPVVVELQAQSRQPMMAGGAGGAYSGQMDPDGQSRRIEVGSTLAVPLGEWVVVARSGSQVQRQQRGTLSTRDLDEDQQAQLEIRITAP
jgi:hypothetical protein